MKNSKKILIIIVVIILILSGIKILLYRELDLLDGKNLDLNIETVDQNYTLVKFSEIQCCLYQNKEQQQIDKLRNSNDYPNDKLEGESKTVLDGVGICLVEGRITKYAVTNQNIVVYERDSQQYYNVRKIDGKVTFKSKNKKEIEKQIGVKNFKWKNVGGSDYVRTFKWQG